MATVLVTGGAGFIGTHLCQRLHDSGHNVISLDSHQTGDCPWNVIQADIRDDLQFEGIEVVVHLAAQISVPASIDNPDETLSVNVDGTASIISMAEKSGVNRIIFASSAAVYGDSEEIPIKENTPLMPQSPYAVSKIVGEQLVKQSAVESCSMRFFNVYGPGQSADGGYAAVIPAFKKAIESDLPPVIFGDGTQVRDFIHIVDLVRIIEIAVTTDDIPSEVNIASGKATSLLDLISALQSQFPSMSEPLFETNRPGDIHTSLADITLMNSRFSPGQIISLKEGLK